MHKLFHQYNMKAIKILDFEHAHLRKMLDHIFHFIYCYLSHNVWDGIKELTTHKVELKAVTDKAFTNIRNLCVRLMT